MVLLVGGLYLPQTTVVLGGVVLFGRVLNSCCYALRGPGARVLGAIISNYPFYLYMVAVFGYAVVSSVSSI